MGFIYSITVSAVVLSHTTKSKNKIKDLPPKIKTHVSILYLKSYSGRKIHKENLFLKTLNEVLRS